LIITVKTTGLLGKYLPPGSKRNRGEVEVADGSTVQQLLDTLGVPDNGRCYVTFNSTLLKSAELAQTVISEEDEIVLMAPIGAG